MLDIEKDTIVFERFNSTSPSLAMSNSLFGEMKIASNIYNRSFPSFAAGQAATRPKYPPTKLALQHFDAAYSVQLGKLWPSVRVALLSERKYGALLNNFSHDGVLEDLQAQGCRDFISDKAEEGGCAYLV